MAKIVRFRSLHLELLALSIVLCGGSLAQLGNAICEHGTGTLQAELGGVLLHVGPSRIGELATRTCMAELTRNKQVHVVARNAARLGVDIFAGDLGHHAALIAFQQASDALCCAEYQIFSLVTPDSPLRKITGGSSFYAADTDLDGQVEIWAQDGAVIENFEGLNLAEFDAAPTIVLRFVRGKLLDVSSEFQEYYDRKISVLRQQLSSTDLRDFKNAKSDPAASAKRAHQLRSVKTKVLSIVWAYLYSGREEQAWASLAEMWPDEDMPRIRELIANARARGIHCQIDGDAPSDFAKRKKRAPVFDATRMLESSTTSLQAPLAIILTRPPVLEQPTSTASDAFLELVIDSAGKVFSVKTPEKHSVDRALVAAARSWTFVPAFKGGVPVASRIRLSVSLKK